MEEYMKNKHVAVIITENMEVVEGRTSFEFHDF